MYNEERKNISESSIRLALKIEAMGYPQDVIDLIVRLSNEEDERKKREEQKQIQ